MFFGLSNGYLLLIVVTLAIGGLATWYVNSQLKKYTHVPISTGLTTAAIVMYAAVVIFQLVTLPVEFNASQRAMAYMNTTGLPQAEQAGSFNVLRACALTYVAAALTSILQLLWLLGQRRD